MTDIAAKLAELVVHSYILVGVYVVTWNLNKEKSNYNTARTAFIQQLEKYSNKADSGLESVRFIKRTIPSEINLLFG